MLVFNPLKAGVSPVLFELDFCCFLGEKRALNSNVWASFVLLILASTLFCDIQSGCTFIVLYTTMSTFCCPTNVYSRTTECL